MLCAGCSQLPTWQPRSPYDVRFFLQYYLLKPCDSRLHKKYTEAITFIKQLRQGRRFQNPDIQQHSQKHWELIWSLGVMSQISKRIHFIWSCFLEDNLSNIPNSRAIIYTSLVKSRSLYQVCWRARELWKKGAYFKSLVQHERGDCWRVTVELTYCHFYSPSAPAFNKALMCMPAFYSSKGCLWVPSMQPLVKPTSTRPEQWRFTKNALQSWLGSITINGFVVSRKPHENIIKRFFKFLFI